MSTKTTNYEFYKPELSDPADITKMNTNWDKVDQELVRSGTKIVNVSSNDGVTYTGELLGVSALYVGLKIVIIPNRNSSSTDVKLNVNGLGEVYVIMPVNDGSTGASGNGATSETWLSANVPVEITFDGTFWRTDIKALSTAVMTRLLYTSGTTDMEDGVTPLETGKLYFYYEG